MSVGYPAPLWDVWAKRGCPKCGGRGHTGHDETDHCDCIHEQILHKHDFIRLADGEIEVHHAE